MSDPRKQYAPHFVERESQVTPRGPYQKPRSFADRFFAKQKGLDAASVATNRTVAKRRVEERRLHEDLTRLPEDLTRLQVDQAAPAAAVPMVQNMMVEEEKKEKEADQVSASQDENADLASILQNAPAGPGQRPM